MTHSGGPGRSAFVAAWAAVLGDLSSDAGTLTLLHGDDADGIAESQRLVEAAALAGLKIQALAFHADGELPLGLAAVDNPVIVGQTVADGSPAGRDAALRALFEALQAATPQPILTTRLDSVFLGADMALAQAPEQRGEQMAWLALRDPSPDAAAPAFEMAVALDGEFAQRRASTLPAFYLASARLSGFLATPDNRARVVQRPTPGRAATPLR